MLKEISFIFLVFLAGAVAALNLSYIKYGIPLHFNGGWGKFAFTCFLALVFGAMAVKEHT